MSINETNTNQSDKLRALREAIHNRKELFELVKDNEKVQLLSYSEVPEITLQSTAEFQPERYEQLCLLMDVLYFNWKLAVKQNEETESRLKALALAVDEWMFESIKPRFH